MTIVATKKEEIKSLKKLKKKACETEKEMNKIDKGATQTWQTPRRGTEIATKKHENWENIKDFNREKKWI